MKHVILAVLLLMIAACEDPSVLDATQMPPTEALQTTAVGSSSMTEDYFILRAMTTGPDYQFFRVTAPYEECDVSYIEFSGHTVEAEELCTDFAVVGTKALPYNGGHTDLYATINGVTKFIDLAPGDLSAKVNTLHVPYGAPITVAANAYCDFEFHDVEYDSGGYTRSFSDTITVAAGDISMIESSYHCTE